MCDEPSFQPLSPCATSRNETEKLGVKLSPGKKRAVNRRCFTIWFYFLLPYSDLIGNKLN